MEWWRYCLAAGCLTAALGGIVLLVILLQRDRRRSGRIERQPVPTSASAVPSRDPSGQWAGGVDVEVQFPNGWVLRILLLARGWGLAMNWLLLDELGKMYQTHISQAMSGEGGVGFDPGAQLRVERAMLRYCQQHPDEGTVVEQIELISAGWLEPGAEPRKPSPTRPLSQVQIEQLTNPTTRGLALNELRGTNSLREGRTELTPILVQPAK